MVDSPNFHTLGERIRKVRRDSRLSQKAFSRICGVSPLTLMRYETGNRGPDARFLIRLSENFNVNANWLLCSSGEAYLNDVNVAGGESQALDTQAVSALFREFADYLKSRSDSGDPPRRGETGRAGNGSAAGVLIVSPDRQLSARVRGILEVFQVEMLESAGTREAERLIEFREFGLVVLDTGLGSVRCRRLVEHVNRNGEAGILLVTASGNASAVEIGFRLVQRDSPEKLRLNDSELLVNAGRLLGASAKVAKM